MYRIGVAEVKARLSEYLARVRAGEEILITDRGRPIARLAPTRGDDRFAEQENLDDLARAGIVSVAPTPLPAAFWDEDVPDDHAAAMRHALAEERERGR